ncbi:phage tail-collar fiber domain-containing protein [Pseudomonas sp. EL_65y_Pfl2_R96]|uniref:phage tail-collar fiber domain-containing protein n=1 Tax=Pseudomonas sp. EL_65y_Pfl2_R96 TaxID=3088699 RepID=UPI0030DDAB07
MADYYTLLTNAGIAYETACKAAGTPIKLSQISVGDGGGAIYNPAATATALKREVWRGPLNALFQDEKNPSWLLAEVTIPPEVGGWYVREAGLWTDTGILYAIVKYPESFKPVLATSGSGKEFYIRSIFETSNAALVTLLIDDTVVKATRAWVMSYLAEELGKLDGKQSVRVAATGNVVLNGAKQVDGVAVIAGDRVLLPNQTLAKDNGLWIVANGDWVRANDANVSAKVAPGLTVMVEEGTQNGDSLWHLTTNGPINLGTTALTFEMLAGRTGIAPGTYKSLTVDKYGRATAGANPETLAGFGIKDSYTKTEIEGMIASASMLPVGAIVAFPGDTPPLGFLELDNSVKSTALYPDLSAYLAGKYNKGDEGAGNFRLPDGRGEFLRGWDHGRGVDGGRTIGSYQVDTLQNITGTFDGYLDITAAGGAFMLSNMSTSSTPLNQKGAYHGVYFDASKVARTSTETRPRNLAVMWCIKAWNAPINQGNIDIGELAAEVQALGVNGPIIGTTRKLKALLPVASQAVTYAAEEIVLENKLGGMSYKLANVSATLSLSASTGLGYMDTGIAPVNGYVAVYLLYNPATRMYGAIGVNATAAEVPEVYGGNFAPVGYTASALLGVLPTNASAQFKPGKQKGRTLYFPYVNALATSTTSATLVAFSVAAYIPKNAISVSGALAVSGTGSMNSSLAGDSIGSGWRYYSNTNAAGSAPFDDLIVDVSQTLYYSATQTSLFSVFLSSYTI